jgi:hypothetical protein
MPYHTFWITTSKATQKGLTPSGAMRKRKTPQFFCPSSLLRFAHKTSKNRFAGDCEPTVRFTLQTAFEPLVRGCPKTYKRNRLLG